MSLELIYDSTHLESEPTLYQQEYDSMTKAGVTVKLTPSDEATSLLRRGFIVDESEYPNDPRYIQNAKTYISYCRIDHWYDRIVDLTIPTIFIENLDKAAAIEIKRMGWTRAFIKDGVKSLMREDPLDSVWPDVSFESMLEQFSRNPRKGHYALRKYLPPEHFESERRYWVIGDQVHHSSGRIPGIVKEAKARLDAFGGIFYTIDATDALIVEINPGESSEKKPDNSAEDFASWIREAFGG
jgi:hypothetical protein